jgi:uncharacterized membrane protein YjgN (DUF898 family)
MGASAFIFRGVVSRSTLSVILTFGLYLPVVYIARQYVHARTFNAAWNGTRLDESQFKADMRPNVWIALQLMNWAAIICSLGLMYPWAATRSARYTASCLHFFPSPDFYRIQELGAAAGSAVGDSAAEFIGLDFGL